MKIDVKTSTNTYDVIIENNILEKVNEYVSLNGKVLIVTDDGVPSKYVKTLSKQCEEPYVFTFSHGEESKNINTYQEIISYMISNNFTRSDLIIALGGGVVGDLAAFVASTFNRGVKFVNIPTTLLSQVDSSIGGKTAIDYDGIKNVIGTFYPPSLVLIDPVTLKTLDKRQFNAGLVEVIKMAATSNESLFELIENSKNIYKDIEDVIYQALLIKKHVVEEDEKEKGLRKILNYGHTIGHAIEATSDYLHGECVGLGMLYMSSNEVKDRLIKVLTKYNLPTKVDANKDKLFSFILHDKKRSGRNIDIVLVDKIGESYIKTIDVIDIDSYMKGEN